MIGRLRALLRSVRALYPQDMIMIMDKEVAKPDTYGLLPGWTASMMGMMALIRVLPPNMYDEVQR